MSDLKICDKCGKTKPLSDFGIKNKDGELRKICKRCYADKSRLVRLKRVTVQPIPDDGLTIDGEAYILSTNVYWSGFTAHGEQRPPVGCRSKKYDCAMLDKCRRLQREGKPVACERFAVQVVGEVELIW